MNLNFITPARAGFAALAVFVAGKGQLHYLESKALGEQSKKDVAIRNGFFSLSAMLGTLSVTSGLNISLKHRALLALGVGTLSNIYGAVKTGLFVSRKPEIIASPSKPTITKSLNPFGAPKDPFTLLIDKVHFRLGGKQNPFDE